MMTMMMVTPLLETPQAQTSMNLYPSNYPEQKRGREEEAEGWNKLLLVLSCQNQTYLRQ